MYKAESGLLSSITSKVQYIVPSLALWRLRSTEVEAFAASFSTSSLSTSKLRVSAEPPARSSFGNNPLTRIVAFLVPVAFAPSD